MTPSGSKDLKIVEIARQCGPALVLEIDLIPARAVPVRTAAPRHPQVANGKPLEEGNRAKIDRRECEPVTVLLGVEFFDPPHRRAVAVEHPAPDKPFYVPLARAVIRHRPEPGM